MDLLTIAIVGRDPVEVRCVVSLHPSRMYPRMTATENVNTTPAPYGSSIHIPGRLITQSLAAMSQNVSVLVVCLGNICRSPIGEAVMKHVAKERGLDVTVDSAGTSNYHIGEDPDDR